MGRNPIRLSDISRPTAERLLKLSSGEQVKEKAIVYFKLYVLLTSIKLDRRKNYHEYINFCRRLEKNQSFHELRDKLALSGLVEYEPDSNDSHTSVQSIKHKIVICFACGLQLRNFENCDPQIYHAYLSPQCIYLDIVFGKKYILESRLKILDKVGQNPMDIDETPSTDDALMKTLFRALKEFVSSTQMSVAKEFDYPDDWCIAVFVTKFLLTQNPKPYASAGDFVTDLEDATYKGAIEDPSTREQYPVFAIEGTFDVFNGVVQQYSEVDSERWNSKTENATTFKIKDHPVSRISQFRDPNPEPVASPSNSLDSGISNPSSSSFSASSSSYPSSFVSLPSSSSSSRTRDQKLHEETALLYFNSRCKRCFKQQANHVVLPCSELSICSQCIGVATSCPACKGPIIDSIQTFM